MGFSFAVQTGFNLSKFRNDTMDIRNVLLPFLGLNIRYSVAPKFNIQAGMQYSFRGGNVKTPITKFRNDYFDVQLTGMYDIFKELKIQAGVQYAMSISSSLQKKVMENILKYTEDRYSPSQFEFIAGLELAVHRSTNVGFLYTIPLKNMDYSNLQFTIRIRFFEKVPSKKENR